MRGKHAIGNRPFGNIHLDYIRYKDSDKDIRQMYERVKNDYLKNKNLDMDLEKAYLNERFISYKGDIGKYYLNVLMISLAAFLGGIFTQYFNRSFMTLSILIAFIIIVVKFFSNIHTKIMLNKEKYEHKYYIICIEALKEIEHEQNSIIELENIN
ncbi:hypothetical protein NE172_10300 [Clostridium botulinum]|uniref:Uncharacterized protein n=1 Tax=Clostridium botulinum TaxID=1491 RepID=A0A6B4JNQ9_CLOBO|nr:hypothetical protein [Clostridium botulinum]EES50255.1 hypothetical protein CLO_1734 [Clostridium botulinum E1 str. 'BoNT E Beluga']MBY6761973.1 hypothetical protein [Clostridium botulinum]MBY6920899.1 hypothetical protein [Clostridium botulinum]MCR1131351.1 hypothetical protein [Clostridium botulinum]NFH69730.1 hypothetical protein [Clostridium botulinum]